MIVPVEYYIARCDVCCTSYQTANYAVVKFETEAELIETIRKFGWGYITLTDEEEEITHLFCPDCCRNPKYTNKVKTEE